MLSRENELLFYVTDLAFLYTCRQQGLTKHPLEVTEIVSVEPSPTSKRAQLDIYSVLYSFKKPQQHHFAHLSFTNGREECSVSAC